MNKASAEEKLQALLAEARSILAVAKDLAEEHGLDMRFDGVMISDGEEQVLDANEKMVDRWNDSGCTDY